MFSKTTKKYRYKWHLRILLVVLFVVGILLLTNMKQHTCRKCNVILVSIDTLSAQHLPCYGYKKNTAPNLCNYAKQNILFTNSYSQSPTTLNSHFSIITSLYPTTHKMVNIGTAPLDNKFLTLSQILRKNGYDTIYHGPASDPHLPLDQGFERGFNTIEFGKYDSVNSWKDTFPKLLKNSREGKPTFIFFHTYDVHAPYFTGHSKKHPFTDLPEYQHIPLTPEDLNKPSLAYYKGIVDCTSFMNQIKIILPQDVKSDLDNVKKLNDIKTVDEGKEIYDKLSLNTRSTCGMWWYGHLVNTKDRNQVDYLRAMYDEKILTMDSNITALLDFLQNPLIKDNTILIITSDHGEEFMEHGTLFHGNNISKVATQVPLIMHIPGVVPREISDIVQGIDILPTILSLIGLPSYSQAEGIDLSGLILNRPNPPKNSFVKAEYNGEAAIQYKNWRYYFNEQTKIPHQLFDITRDPLEQNNILVTKLKR